MVLFNIPDHGAVYEVGAAEVEVSDHGQLAASRLSCLPRRRRVLEAPDDDVSTSGQQHPGGIAVFAWVESEDNQLLY